MSETVHIEVDPYDLARDITRPEYAEWVQYLRRLLDAEPRITTIDLQNQRNWEKICFYLSLHTDPRIKIANFTIWPRGEKRIELRHQDYIEDELWHRLKRANDAWRYFRLTDWSFEDIAHHLRVYVDNILPDVSNGRLRPGSRGHNVMKDILAGMPRIGRWVEEQCPPEIREIVRSQSGSATKGKVRFDFWLKDLRVLIEIDGQQHHTPVAHWGGIEAFEAAAARDRAKADAAVKEGFGLVRVKAYLIIRDTRPVFC